MVRCLLRIKQVENNGERRRNYRISNSEILSIENVTLMVFRASEKFLPQRAGPTCMYARRSPYR